jgi:flagellin-like protein
LNSRGVAPVVSTVLMVAVVVVLAAVLSAFALGFGADVDDAAPIVGQSSGTFEAFEDGSDEQIVTIRHVAGDEVPVDEMEVAVSAACSDGTKRGRLVDLPVDGNSIDDENVEGTDVFDKSPDQFWGGDLGALKAATFTAGEKIEFRLAKSKCEVPDDGTVTVRVVHVPTNAVVIEQQLTAQ